MIKQWFESKTVWLGILTTLSGVLSLVADFLQNGQLSSIEGWMLLGVGVVGIVIRIWFTDTSIE